MFTKPQRGMLSALVSLVIIGSFLAMQAKASNVSQNFVTTTNLVNGSLVAFDNNSDKNVVAANSNNVSRLLGVAVGAQVALINLDQNQGNVAVVTNGSSNVLVSDINGEVKSGDVLTASPISGVAMKATAPTRGLGRVQADFNKGINTSSQDITDKSGKTQSVKITTLPVFVSVGNFDGAISLGTNSLVVGVQSIAYNATGKTISPLRALIALTVLIVAVAISIVILYTSVASSIRSIGRNPLSKSSILQSLIQVILAVIVIMLSGFSIAYIIIGR